LTARTSVLGKRIRNEIEQIQRAASHAQRDWQKYQRTADDAFLKATAYDLHGFYGGLERIFVLIAETLDGQLASGEGWHRSLLKQMASEMKGVRPAILSDAAHERLDDFLRFRHLVRNLYSFNLLPGKVQNLIEVLPTTSEQVCRDFIDFVESFLEPLPDESS
jgi:hypothetical protein